MKPARLCARGHLNSLQVKFKVKSEGYKECSCWSASKIHDQKCLWYRLNSDFLHRDSRQM